MSIREGKRDVEDQGGIEKEAPIETPTKRVQIKKSKKVQAEKCLIPLNSYRPPVPYPHTC